MFFSSQYQILKYITLIIFYYNNVIKDNSAFEYFNLVFLDQSNIHWKGED